ncbi:hypothetical protein [Aeromonas caviae]|uniref:hypothetical protein n=1 Tax=Aeromonas caviae TaxID=648 RepID=UPI003AF3FCF8
MRELLSKATFVPLPGTPLSSEDRDTRAVFGVYIHVNGMQCIFRSKMNTYSGLK